MIELITGLPGNGKTLYTISRVKERAERENRPVYYHGIAELNIPSWTLLEDPTKWMEVPPKSIIVLDEAQKTFRNRSMGQVPPKHVTDLETHRHLGIDLVLITQHPSLVDPAVRRLAGRHEHLVRVWGMEASTVHRWDAVKDNCDKSRSDSEKTKWAFDKKVYGYYKSAEVHTMKRSIPGRVKLIGFLIVAFVALVGFGYHLITNRIIHKVPEKAVEAPGLPGVSSSTSTSPGMLSQGQKQAGWADPVADVKEYAWKETPRVVGVPQTAPKYDQLTVPTRVPVPAMCIQKGSVRDSDDVTCKCYSQQATPMDGIPLNMCIEFARNGHFQDFDPDKDRVAAERTQASVDVLANRQDAPLPVRQVQDGPRVSVLPGQPSGPGRTDKSPPMSVDGVIQDGSPNNRATRAVAVAGI